MRDRLTEITALNPMQGIYCQVMLTSVTVTAHSHEVLNNTVEFRAFVTITEWRTILLCVGG